MAQLTLNWPSAPRRSETPTYRIDHEPGVSDTRTVLDDGGGYDVIVRVGRALDKPVHSQAAVYQQLAQTKPSTAGVLLFVAKYGCLVNTEREAVAYFLRWRRAIKQLLAAKKRDDWTFARRWMAANEHGLRLEGMIGEDEDGRPQLEFRPVDLLSFIVAQLLQDWSNGATYKFCKRPGCGEYFYYGPGTKHRSTAEYCSPRCQSARAYSLRKGVSK